ncbi:MAG: hypothetical protein Q9157_004230 [Trypethelium eluteriae]
MPSFLDLPRELRDIIYQYIIPHKSINQDGTYNEMDHESDLNFALANQQICTEFSQMCKTLLRFPLDYSHLGRDCRAVATCIRIMNQPIMDRIGSIPIMPDRSTWNAFGFFSIADDKPTELRCCSAKIMPIILALRESRLKIHLLFKIPPDREREDRTYYTDRPVLAAGISQCVNQNMPHSDFTGVSPGKVSSSSLQHRSF